MAARAGKQQLAARACIAAAVLVLAGCGGHGHGASASATTPELGCPATVATVLSHVVRRVYHEGVASERTEVARRAIAGSSALRAAVEAKDPAAARAAAAALVAQGHLTNLRVTAAGRTLADVGGPAVAPFGGELKSASGAVIGSYVTSVWSDEGLLAESQGLAQARIALRVDGRSVGGSLRLAGGHLPSRGEAPVRGVPSVYASFGGEAYPAGHLRVYVVRTVASTDSLCGANAEETTFNVLSRIARAIYQGEAGNRTQPQVRRVQHDAALLAAVARNDPSATRQAVEALLNQHIVRLRVYGGGTRLLADVGGPYVLAPVSAPLRLHGRTIGSFVLSIQDDEGYLRLARRLAGLRVLMYMSGTLVKNSLGPEPGTVPASGSYSYRGSNFRVLTLHAGAFPSGPLTIRVLIPTPYT